MTDFGAVLQATLPAPSRRAGDAREQVTGNVADLPEGASAIELDAPAGVRTIVDADDFEFLSSMRWCGMPRPDGAGMAVVQLLGNAEHKARRLYMHRIIMRAYFDESVVVDHINGDPLDNRRCNLRVCTRQQNLWNRRKRKGSSPFKGVHIHSRDGAIRAQIRVNGQQVRLGTFLSEIDGALAYDAAARLHFGAFACVNFPGPNEQGALPPHVLKDALEQLACRGQEEDTAGRRSAT